MEPAKGVGTHDGHSLLATEAKLLLNARLLGVLICSF